MAKKKQHPSEKELRFCQEYVVDSNGAQAAIRAGFSATSARQIANRLLSKDYIQAEIARLRQEIQDRNAITVDWIVKRLRRESLRVGEGSSHSARVNALTQLGRHLGMFEDSLSIKAKIQHVEDLDDAKLLAIASRNQPS